MESPRLKTVIQDVDDLTDNIEILAEQVKQLAKPKLTKGEISILIDEYIRLEDSILEGIDVCSKNSPTAEDQEAMLEQIESFNKLGCDFQESWKPEIWQQYNKIRGLKTHENSPDLNRVKNKPIRQINLQLNDIKELALASSKRHRGNRPSLKASGPFGSHLKFIDDENDKYLKAEIEHRRAYQQGTNRSCCGGCTIF